MSIKNWVKLEPGTRSRMHFKDYMVTERTITDPFFKVPIKQASIVFLVDRLDGKEVTLKFSVLSEKVSDELDPYLKDGTYRNYEWVFEKPADMTAAPRVTRLPL